MTHVCYTTKISDTTNNYDKISMQPRITYYMSVPYDEPQWHSQTRNLSRCFHRLVRIIHNVRLGTHGYYISEI